MNCADCHEEIPYHEERYENRDGDTICKKCDQHYGTCDKCGKPTHDDNLYYRNCSPELFEARPPEEESLCEDCIQAY